MNKEQLDLEIKKNNEKLSELNQKINSYENSEERAKYLKKHMNEYNKIINEGMDLLNKSFDEMEKELKQIKKGNINIEENIYQEKTAKKYKKKRDKLTNSIHKSLEELDKEKVKTSEYIFQTDENGAYIRLLIPKDFVNSVLDKEEEISFIGKKQEDLNKDELKVLKKYHDKICNERKKYDKKNLKKYDKKIAKIDKLSKKVNKE